MTVVTRFAPSPTGFLHIGGARTALFNWLYARRHGGTFLLRIEDTDRARSTQAAVDAILDGMRWLGLDWDGEAVSQFGRQARHAEVAHAMLERGLAYRCYATQEELAELRARQEAAREPTRYDGRWRDRDPAEAPAGAKPVIRLKAPQEGSTIVRDRVRGEVEVQNAQLDDMVLLRSDGTPTYMLAVVVDDHDMGVTHVIRGDDHFTNTFRQLQIYRAMGWDEPEFAHVPLIHGPDGAKLSKRHGALGVDAYREMGYLPEAIRNYLLRLGWSHGDEEIIPTARALEVFDLEGIGKSPARFDFAKLDSLNGHYLREADDARLVELAAGRLAASGGRTPTDGDRARLAALMPGLKTRAKTLKELADGAAFLVRPRPLALEEKAAALLDAAARSALRDLAAALAALPDWTPEALEAATRAFAEARGEKLGRVAQPLRAALTGSTQSPPVFDVAAVLGREETSARIGDVLSGA
jgi:glutamyl-tRNA synthetase